MSTASIPPAHDARALYVFCVARAGVALPDGDGLDAAGSLHTVASAGLAALVCEVALADFTGPGGEANLGDLAWLGPRALPCSRCASVACSPRLPRSSAG
jgi:hypothetical protein